MAQKIFTEDVDGSSLEDRRLEDRRLEGRSLDDTSSEAARRDIDAPFAGLAPVIYDELRGVARRQLRRLRPGQTLDTTALVHEAYLKLADHEAGAWQNHAHFVAVAAVAMRHLLVDYARNRSTQKRGGDVLHVTLGDHEVGLRDKALDLLVVDEALEALAERSERLAKLVELRFFGGLSVPETAEVMGTSERTVKRDWRKARAVLMTILGVAAGNAAGGAMNPSGDPLDT